MATWEDVRRLATAFPGVEEGTSYGSAAWKVRKKAFVWERPLRKGDLADLGWAEQPGPVLGVLVPDLGAKEAVLAEDAETCFTTPHFDGHPSVLVHLDRIDGETLADLIAEAWFVRAPVTLQKQVSGPRGRPGDDPPSP